MQPTYERALIVRAGDGLSASLARLFHREGVTRIGLAARNVGKLEALIESLGPDACAIPCDASIPSQVDDLFGQFDRTFGAPPEIVVYNASARMRKAFVELSPDDVAPRAQCLGLWRLPGRSGGGKAHADARERRHPLHRSFGQRQGLSALRTVRHGQVRVARSGASMARELAPKGIHVAHFVIDGVIRNPGTAEPPDAPDSMLDPDAIAQTYLHVLRQDRSAWTWEVELRPWVEPF